MHAHVSIVDDVVALCRIHPCFSQTTASDFGTSSGKFEIKEYDLYYYNGLQRRIQGVQMGPQFQPFGMKLLPSNDIRSVEQMAGTAYVREIQLQIHVSASPVFHQSGVSG